MKRLHPWSIVCCVVLVLSVVACGKRTTDADPVAPDPATVWTVDDSVAQAPGLIDIVARTRAVADTAGRREGAPSVTVAALEDRTGEDGDLGLVSALRDAVRAHEGLGLVQGGADFTLAPVMRLQEDGGAKYYQLDLRVIDRHGTLVRVVPVEVRKRVGP